ncbi:MAG: oxidoreductase [Flavobacteriaceae bacterium]|nr:MAG: oxidoreductase [Flavobacteriaceae bacterium]
MLKAGLVGSGHLGKIHLKLLLESTNYKLVGFYDANLEEAKKVSKDYGVPYFESFDALLEEIEVLDIVTPTLYHFEYAKKALEASKHVFIEKPVTNTVEQAQILIDLAHKHNRKVQVGHVERFNPAFLAVENTIESPMFIEAHRLAEFNPRGTDVSVVLDLMIHDLDIILSVVKSPVKEIRSSGVSILSETPDVANARVEFENGCVANISTSRISMKNMRKIRFFQKDTYLSIDFLEKKAERIQIKDAAKDQDDTKLIFENSKGESKELYFESPEIVPVNAILEELNSFAFSINQNTREKVNLEDATKALSLALEIIKAF